MATDVSIHTDNMDSGVGSWYLRCSAQPDRRGYRHDLATQFSSHNGGTAVSDHPNVTTSTRGFMSDPDKVKLNGIATGATTDQTAAEILSALLTVDGPGSGLNADNFDSLNSSQFARSDATDDVLRFRFSNGTLASPSITFTNSTGSGLSWSTSNYMSGSINGNEIFRAAPSGAFSKSYNQPTTGTGLLTAQSKCAAITMCLRSTPVT